MTAPLIGDIDEVLSTTRAVRRRLDLEREVPLEVIEQCVELARQAPIAKNVEQCRFVAVRDPDRRPHATEYIDGMLALIGELVAKAGWGVLTGGRVSGVMGAAAKGARAAGGLTVGLLPTPDTLGASPAIDGEQITSSARDCWV